MTHGASEGVLARDPVDEAPRRDVLLVDAPQERVRRAGDLANLVACAVGILIVLVLAVYANATTQGVTQDVQSAVTKVLRQLLLVPVTVLEGLVTFFVPLAVLIDRLVRRSWRSALEAAITAVVAGLLGLAALWLLDSFAPGTLTRGLTITSDGGAVIALNPYVAALSGLLTAVGVRSRNRMLGWSWNLLWVVLGLAIVQGDQTLPGALVTLLIGGAAGLGMRYASGVLHDRASGISLVRGLRRAGLDPVRVVRMDPLRGGSLARAWTVTTSAPIGYTERLGEPGLPAARVDQDVPRGPEPAESSADADAGPGGVHAVAPEGPVSPTGAAPTIDVPTDDSIVEDALTDPNRVLAEVTSSAAMAPDGESPHRIYAVWDVAGERHDVTVLDGDRHVVGLLASIWDNVRVRGLNRRPATTLRDAASHAGLMSLATRAAGVRAPELVGITESRDSVLIVSEHVPGARQLDELDPAEIDDDLLDQIWHQVRAAHAKGLAHRELQAGAVLVDHQRQVWVVDWENGDIVSSELSRRVDLAQLLAMLAVLVGSERALASAARALSRDQMASAAPLLQALALPRRTRAAVKDHRELIAGLRAELVELVPTADVAPLQLARFSPRTVITVTVAVVAVWLLLGTMNFREVADAVSGANPAWLVAAFTVGLVTYVGSAMSLVAFTPERLGLWRTTLVQMAASVVALVAPAGIGPAAVDLRYLAKQGVATPLAAATVGLVQISRFLTTVLLLVAVALLTGSVGALSMPSGSVIGVVVAVVVAGGVTFLFPGVRSWVWEKIGPTVHQAWPRLVWVASDPKRLVLGLVGNLILTVGYVAAFGASLAAFGYQLPLLSLAITFLVSSSLGSVIPSPGGIGPVEAALTGGLVVAGIPYAAALSVSLVYRLLTFWVRVPLGWAALRYLQRREVL